MGDTVLITGASSGMGELTAYALADEGYTVFASMRDLATSNREKVEAASAYCALKGVDLRTVELDVQDEVSVQTAVKTITEQTGRIDVVIHNAGHMVLGPAEAFTPEQCAAIYDVNVLGTQRVNRAVLPSMRRNGRGLIVWIGSTSTRGGTPPYLAPYFAAKAAMDSFAVSYAAELALWGIETSIVVPGIYLTGTNHFAHAGRPADEIIAGEYADGPTRDLPQRVARGQRSIVPQDADVTEIAQAVVEVVNAPFGERPFRVTVDPADAGADIVSAVADRFRQQMFRRIGMTDLLTPAKR